MKPRGQMLMEPIVLKTTPCPTQQDAIQTVYFEFVDWLLESLYVTGILFFFYCVLWCVSQGLLHGYVPVEIDPAILGGLLMGAYATSLMSHFPLVRKKQKHTVVPKTPAWQDQSAYNTYQVKQAWVRARGASRF